MARTFDDLANETVREGGVYAVLYFDMHAQDKAQLQEIAVAFASKITQEPGVVYARAEIDEPLEYDGAFSTNAEVHAITQTFSALMNLAVRYGPIGVDIIKPDNHLRLTLGEAHDILLNASQNSFEFSKFVVEKLANEEQKAQFRKDMGRRAEIGRKMLEKAKANKEEKK